MITIFPQNSVFFFFLLLFYPSYQKDIVTFTLSNTAYTDHKKSCFRLLLYFNTMEVTRLPDILKSWSNNVIKNQFTSILAIFNRLDQKKLLIMYIILLHYLMFPLLSATLTQIIRFHQNQPCIIWYLGSILPERLSKILEKSVTNVLQSCLKAHSQF